MTKLYKLKLDFGPQSFAELEQLRRDMNIPPERRGEVIKNGLGILQWASDETRRGNTIMVLKPDGELAKTVFPFMPEYKGTFTRAAQAVEKANAEGIPVRLNYTLSSEGFAEIEALKTDLKAASRAEVIRMGLGTLRWAFDQIQEGHQIAVAVKGTRFVKGETAQLKVAAFCWAADALTPPDSQQLFPSKSGQAPKPAGNGSLNL